MLLLDTTLKPLKHLIFLLLLVVTYGLCSSRRDTTSRGHLTLRWHVATWSENQIQNNNIPNRGGGNGLWRAGGRKYVITD